MNGTTAVGRGYALTLLAVSTFLSLSLWFSASFVADQLADEWHLSAVGASLLTIAVQVGFIFGALVSAASGLADALPGRYLMALGAISGAIANIALLGANAHTGIVCRFLTGASLALVYPSALKEVSTWFRNGRGLALGVMIGALTVGSAAPHLIQAFGDVNWRYTISATSFIAGVGALLTLAVRRSGPFPFGTSKFKLRETIQSLRIRAVVLADIGYMGHMWELYAMWAWIGVFLGTVEPFRDGANSSAVSVTGFAVIAIGAVGCLVGGVISDYVGRSHAAFISMAISGSCAILLVFNRHYPSWFTLMICFVWGFWVIADSAQFSAIVTENAVQAFVGGAVALQLACGYAVTILTLWLVPYVASQVSWGAALGCLAFGPIVGSIAMWRSRRYVAPSRPSRSLV